MVSSTLAGMVTDFAPDEDDSRDGSDVILDELAMQRPATETVHEAGCPDRPIGRPVGGTSQATARSAALDVWEHRPTTAPLSLIVAAAGHVDHDHIYRARPGRPGGVPWDHASATAPRPRRSTTTATPIADHEKRATSRDSAVTQAHVLIGCEGLSATDPLGPTMRAA